MSQRMEALAKANTVRLRNAEVKRQIRNREITVAEALCLHDIGSMKVAQLIQAQGWYGDKKTRKTLAAIGASRALRVSELTKRQRAALVKVTER